MFAEIFSAKRFKWKRHWFAC